MRGAAAGFRRAALEEVEAAKPAGEAWSRAKPPAAAAQRGPHNPPPVIGPMLPPTEPDTMVIPWMTLLRAPGGHSLLAGFTSARDQLGVISLRPGGEGGYWCAASSYLEGVTLPPDGVVRSETLLLVFEQEGPGRTS